MTEDDGAGTGRNAWMLLVCLCDSVDVVCFKRFGIFLGYLRYLKYGIYICSECFVFQNYFLYSLC